ncbi:MAG: hypothetical protein PHS86_15675 [Syntrophaceae bacterium]|nr:hypothetical protein [Syntrophaceae bacterium]
MSVSGLFTTSDLETISRAARLAESLTCDFFNLPCDEWKQNPYRMLTIKNVSRDFHIDQVFAHVVRIQPANKASNKSGQADRYGVILQDPYILRGLFKTNSFDLWPLALYVMTHELTHIVRFKKFGIDFFASENHRMNEESVVDGYTRDILTGTVSSKKMDRYVKFGRY